MSSCVTTRLCVFVFASCRHRAWRCCFSLCFNSIRQPRPAVFTLREVDRGRITQNNKQRRQRIDINFLFPIRPAGPPFLLAARRGLRRFGWQTQNTLDAHSSAAWFDRARGSATVCQRRYFGTKHTHYLLIRFIIVIKNIPTTFTRS